MYYHPSRDAGVLVHGDDFTVAGNESELKYVAQVLPEQVQNQGEENSRAETSMM